MGSYFTIEFCEKRLDMWVEAEAALATGQSYKIGTRELRRADLNEVRKQIQFWEDKRNNAMLNGNRRRTYRVVPRDL